MAKKVTPKSNLQVQVILTPGMIPLYDLDGKIAVVIDILRATSSMCVALENGAADIMPVESVEEARSFKIGKFVCAAERDGQKVAGFELGNSPYDYTEAAVKGKSIVMTTTNGTQAINQSRFAHRMVIGAFLNIDKLCQWLLTQDRDILLVCSGWKNKFNLEDTIFAGAVISRIKQKFEVNDDAGIMAENLWDTAKDNLFGYVMKAAHAQRFERLGIERDILFCLQLGTIDLIPEMVGNYLVKMKKA